MEDAKATDAAFAKAAHVVALELINNRVVVNSMEPRNAVADYDPQSGRSTLYTATQGPHFVRDPLAELVLKMPKDMLRLITPNVGGGFGMKAFVYPERERPLSRSARLHPCQSRRLPVAVWLFRSDSLDRSCLWALCDRGHPHQC